MENLKSLLDKLKGVSKDLEDLIPEIEKEVDKQEPSVPVEPAPNPEPEKPKVLDLEYSVEINPNDIQDENTLYHAIKGFNDLSEFDLLGRDGKFEPNLDKVVEDYSGNEVPLITYTRKTKDFDVTVNIEITVKGEDENDENETPIDTIDPIEEIPENPEEPETPETPTGLRVVNVELDEDEDNTATLRQPFIHDNAFYDFSDGNFWAKGNLPTDEVSSHEFQIRNGKHGVIRIEGRENVILEATGTTLYHKAPIVPDRDTITNLFPDFKGYYKAYSPTVSQRKFLRILKSKMIWANGFSGISWNSDEGFKEGKPRYNEFHCFEHLTDVEHSQYVALTNFFGQYLAGDGIRINNCEDVFVKNALIDWNGRQGGATISGKRIYVEKEKILNSRRGCRDKEGNLSGDDTVDHVIAFSEYNAHLVCVPIGGVGLVKNSAVMNSILIGSPIWSRGNGVDRLRENILFVGNKTGNFGRWEHTNNILIDGNEQGGGYNDSISMGDFSNCTNIHVRYNNMPSYGRKAESKEPFYVLLAENTPLEEFKVYDNEQKIGVVNKDIKVRVDQIEPGKWYYKRTDNRTHFGALDSDMVNLGDVFKPTRKATKDDFRPAQVFETALQAFNVSIHKLIRRDAEFEMQMKQVSQGLIDAEDVTFDARDIELILNGIGDTYQIGDTIYMFELTTDTPEELLQVVSNIDEPNPIPEQLGFRLKTVEDLALVSPIEFPEEYVPTEKEAKSIPFETSDYIEFHWNRLYGKSWKPELYVDDGWEPEWFTELKKLKKEL